MVGGVLVGLVAIALFFGAVVGTCYLLGFLRYAVTCEVYTESIDLFLAGAGILMGACLVVLVVMLAFFIGSVVILPALR